MLPRLLVSGNDGAVVTRATFNLFHKPRLRRRVALEKPQQQLHDLFAAGGAGVGAVATEVVAFPDQVVALAAFDAVGPEIRAPEDNRRFHRALGGVAIELGVA